MRLTLQEKARTATLGRRETKGYEEMVNNGRTAVVTAPLLTSLEGGVPVVVDGQIFGAVGVTGLTGAQDARSRKRQQRCWRNKRKRGDKQ
ncbi:heme-binding protein [Shigella flexneri]